MSGRISKRIPWLALVVTGALTLVACGSPSQQAVVTTAEQNRTVTVVGVGQAEATPDVVRATLGVETRAPTLRAALDQANAQAAKLIEALKQLGIAERDIRTESFNVRFEPPSGATRGVYVVDNLVSIVIRDVSRAGTLLDAAVAAGANRVFGISFALSETAPLEAEARQRAVADAQERAQTLAQLNGVSLGPILRVIENRGIGTSPGPFLDAVRLSAVPIEPGQLTVTTQVELVYALRDVTQATSP